MLKIKIFPNGNILQYSVIRKEYVFNGLPGILHVHRIYLSTICLRFVWFLFFVFCNTYSLHWKSLHTGNPSSTQCFQTTGQTIYILVSLRTSHGNSSEGVAAFVSLAVSSIKLNANLTVTYE